MKKVKQLLTDLPYRHKNMQVEEVLTLLLENLDVINIQELEDFLRSKRGVI